MTQIHQPILIMAIVGACGLLLLLAGLLFGRPLWDSFAAVLRILLETLGRLLGFAGRSAIKVGWYFAGLFALIAIAAGVLIWIYAFKPGTLNLAKFRPPACTELLDYNGQILDYLCPIEGLRVWRPLSSIHSNLKTLVVMLEDDKFYEHGGLDIDEIWNALEKNIERKKIARGGSTITQQLAKNLFLTKEKTLFRKASEVPLAIRLERELDKDQILELYLNTIEWGPGVFGAEAASRLYFDHEASELTAEESWLLALMIPNPKELNLWVAPGAKRSLLGRAKHLSLRLYQEHHLSQAESEAAFERFSKFLDAWSVLRPKAYYTGRKFPARWQGNREFTLSEIVSIRHHAAGLFHRYTQKPLRLNIDRTLQEKLQVLQPDAHASDLGNVIAVLDNSRVRALLPASSPELLEQVRKLVEAQGFQIHILPARNIQSSALLP